MKRALLIFSIFAFAAAVSAQTLSPTVIASGGNYASANGTSLSYTIGEMSAVQTFTAGSTILTQGFQQPNDIINGLLDIEKGPDGSFSVYPVPAQTILWFGYEFTEAGKVEVNMTNVLGQKMNFALNEGYDNGKHVHSFDCSTYASGNYFLTVKFTSPSGQEKILTKKVQIVTN